MQESSSRQMQPTSAEVREERGSEPEEFIESMRNHPELWDKKHEWYSNRLKKRAAWNAVALIHIHNWAILGKKDKQAKMKTIKSRWKTLRDNYRREHLRQENVRSGSGAKVSRTYCHYAELQFLKPVMQQRPTESNFSSDNTEDEEQEHEPGTSETNEPQDFENEDLQDTVQPPKKRGNTQKSHQQIRPGNGPPPNEGSNRGLT
ncbi:uncharacterized protein LOC120946102 [Rana temporaria]|uniref:uncharacterized protein LOC120946102 n=1 Tax=Rana temporaria TaxID=8407 RepID=UPI001AADB295|nr:uncharacterized protein LOC120946102 [Rana temporaria]